MTMISFVIPAYNRKEPMKEAIESIIAQSFGNYECIVIITDNCSTDGAFELAQFYAKADSADSIYAAGVDHCIISFVPNFMYKLFCRDAGHS